MTVRTPVFVVAVVDDDQGILQSLEYLLESADYAVRLFASAAACWTAAAFRRSTA